MLATDVLPNELLLEIFSSCDTNSKAALCPVSKLFRQFVEPKMYEIVDIVGGDWRCPIVAFERALFAKPERAHWVRDLSIEAASYQNQSGGTPGAMILDVQKIDRILCKTTELHRLCLKIWHWKNISEFRSLKTGLFPQLRIFQPMTPNFYYIHNSQLAIITSFLNRHPGLSHLYLGGLVPEHSVRSSVYLPNLVVLEGPHSILEHAPKLCSLKLTVPVAWGTDVAFDLTRFSSISHLAFAVQGSIQNIEVAFELLKQQLPRVTFLAIMRQPPYYGSISDLASTISRHLPDLKHIQSFELHGSSLVDKQQRDSIVDSWIQNCPALQKYVIQTREAGTERFKVVNGRPRPTTEFSRTETVFGRFNNKSVENK